MKTADQIRQAYVSFYKERGHEILPSASLLPENDPSTLFTGSGMQPMVPYLLGEVHPSGTRLADSQKCFRAQDIDDVGDNRHTVFFEMLGNWSLGDYFKQEQIPWIFEFVCDRLGLDPKRLYVTCFRGNEDLNIPKDQESAGLWKILYQGKGIEAEIVDFSERDGMQGGRIFYYDETKNWWSRSGKPENMPEGEPGGPDTEMFWDFGEALGLHQISRWKDKPCHVNCDCGRFLEIGNSVFMEYKKTANGFEKLAQRNVDFGGGLERMAAALNDDMDIFRIDVFAEALVVLENLSGKIYGKDREDSFAFRVILDHLRAAVFLIADNAFPSNKDQGYFVRRLIRRSVRFAHKLGIQGQFSAMVARVYIETYKKAYPALFERSGHIILELEKEEAKFARTLEKGMKRFADLTGGLAPDSEISGEQAFDLYQTYGFPIELTEELAREHALKVDIKTFDFEKEKHQNISRSGSEKKFKGGLADHSEMSVKYHTATHLLHAATIKVLGRHATQKGSNITPERLRFDFAHPDKLTDEQIKELEHLVNAAIQRDYRVSFEMMSVEEARKKGAIGLFEENYGDKVKIYTVGDQNQKAEADPDAETFSREFCGGPHVEHTGVLGHFKITKEESVGAGLRRIKAVLS